MPLSFPANPTVGDTYTVGTRTWTWDGTIWSMQAATLGVASISSTEIVNGAITAAKIASGAVTNSKIGSDVNVVTVCTSSTRPASPFTGQAIFETDTNKMKLYNGSSWIGVSTVKKVASFSSSGSWTVPAGVTYAIAHIRGGGGGCGRNTVGGAGGTSSVAFASGTISATGGGGTENTGLQTATGVAPPANSGQGASLFAIGNAATEAKFNTAPNGAYIVAGGAVTPGVGITVTVGAGGTAGNGTAGGSGYVWIEYEE